MTSSLNSSSSSSSAAVPMVVQSAGAAPVARYGAHPAATLFPMMRGKELGQLVDDIAANGLREEIVLYEGQILDGRNRLRACELAGVKPRFVAWDGRGSPLAFVLSRNLHRRHLDESQRSVIAARAKEMFKDDAAERQRAHQFGSRDANPPSEVRQGRKRRVSSVCVNLHTPRGVNAQAAELLNVSSKSVATATRVLAAGDEQVIAAVEEGRISVSDAASIVELPKPRQREALRMVRSGKTRTLRAAAKVKQLKEFPPAVLASNPREPAVMRGKVRRAHRFFMADYDSMSHYIDLAAEASGGANKFTQRARKALDAAKRAMENLVAHYGRPKQS